MNGVPFWLRALICNNWVGTYIFNVKTENLVFIPVKAKVEKNAYINIMVLPTPKIGKQLYNM